MRRWTEAQQAETLDAEKAIAFSENLRRQSRWVEIDHHLLDMLKQELQEKYFVVTGNEDDHFRDRAYSLKPGIRAEEVPKPLLGYLPCSPTVCRKFGKTMKFTMTMTFSAR